jgi:hypothetical protein
MIYETKEDREIERKAMERLAKFGQLEYLPLAPLAHVDAIMFRGNRIMRVVEFKRRDCDRGTHNTIVLDVEKVESGLETGVLCGAPFCFAAQWNDQFAVLKIESGMKARWKIESFAARERAVYDVFHIPTNLPQWIVVP